MPGVGTQAAADLHAGRIAGRGGVTMIEDDVINEVRSAREAFTRSHGYNVRAMVADLRAQDDRGDWPVVRLTRRPSSIEPVPLAPNPEPIHSSMSVRPDASGG